jgi:G3E family GTPase
MSSLFDPDRSAERLPVSLITGFLGSGKTTLLNRLVQRPELADSLVIINEFGEVALDHLLVAPVEGETVVLASGCLCCAVRGDLQDTLSRLLVERDEARFRNFSGC